MNPIRNRAAWGLCALTTIFATGTLIAEEAKPVTKENYIAPENPGLAVGAAAPDVTLHTIDGKDVEMSSLWKDKPVIVTFYRGGWCPYCTKALAEWQTRMDDVAEAGATFVAITPEKPTLISKTAKEFDLGYTVLSDGNGDAQRAYLLQFTLDDATIAKYKGYGIDLEKSNVDGTWTLPSPATFVIDTDGTVRWVFADWNYKKRADPDEVLSAVLAIESAAD